MGLFGKKKQEEHLSEQERLDEEMRDDISKAYDELVSSKPSDNGDEAANKEEQQPVSPQDFENEVFKAKIRSFKEKKTQEAMREVLELLPGRKFFLPSVSNMKEPFEKDGDTVRLKKGAVLNPALLSSQDKTTFLPIFTDQEAMTQKSPSGVVLQFNFDQCMGIVYNKNNPVKAIVINPFTENFVLGEDLLNAAFKKVEESK